MTHLDFTRKALSLAVIPVTVLTLAACASSSQARFGSAATTPLNDLNVVRTEILPALEQAQKEPYVLPVDQSCDALVAQIRKLDEVLGADLDVPASESNPGLIERGTGTAEDTAIGAFQRTAEGIIPFRSWIRKLTGAEEHSRKLAAAISAGIVRRAFLKGIGASHGCTWGALAPSAPVPPSAPTPVPAPPL